MLVGSTSWVSYGVMLRVVYSFFVVSEKNNL